MPEKLKHWWKSCWDHLDDTHHAAHLAYLGAVYVESSYFYAKIAGGLFVITLLLIVHEKTKGKRKGK